MPTSAKAETIDELRSRIAGATAAVLLKRAAGIAKASANPLKIKIGKVSRAQVREIAQTKLPDLNTDSIESAMRIVEGAARSMGIEIVG